MKKLMNVLLIISLMLIVGITYGEESSSKLKISVIERFRFTGWDNAVSLDENADDAAAFTRHRTSLALKWQINPDLEFNLKLTNEFRNYLTPKNREFEIHEVIFDQLYVKWKNVGKLPLTLTLGRQNIIMGEGFLVFEAHPLDGSRSIYFNAARADYQFNKNHRLTAFYSYQPETDDILPVLNEPEFPQPLIEQPERGLALYYTGMFAKTGVEAYFIRKDMEDTADRLASGINTLGARVHIPLATRLALTTEGAYQFGTYGDFDRAAFGGYFHLDYTFNEKTPLLKTFTFGGIYLSGDDPATEKIEGWDAVFGRWPKWSESYIYTLVKENSVAYWSNLNSLYLSLAMDLTERMNLTLTWYHLGANERGTTAFTGGSGKTRGDLFIGMLKFRINKYFDGHVLWEHFNPGNFYFAGADGFNWIRFELMFKI